MNQILLLTGIVIVICILSGRLIDKLGVPSLLAFILLGMCFGVDGIFKISFDDYQFSETDLFRQSYFHHVLWWFRNEY